MAMLSNGKHFFHFPIEAILCAGLYPNVAATEQGIAAVALSNFRKSTNSASKAYTVCNCGQSCSITIFNVITFYRCASFFNFVYSQVETNKVFLRDTTIISPFSILLFGGSINIQHQVSILFVL
ncbi:hypothetical protein JRO89_XS06G0167600 [Xanthoceras sorbifolium]|uniref:DEAD-box helicase OB fold domain-containing protein n=1 Tax=Xanthoceras sorbifolium TaxID=99658 RepID=A0ABQ8HYN3_9ROSI|nr:hypothetical protein JRO89_XS06G0167600 [Xanthoceras sorbifolium]